MVEPQEQEMEGSTDVTEVCSGEWKMQSASLEKFDEEDPEMVVGQLLQSVNEVQNDYERLRAELVEVQALQRELSSRLRVTLQQVHGKFDTLRDRIAAVPPR